MVPRRRSLSEGTLLPSGATYHPSFLSEEEHDALVAVVDGRLGKRRYERDHWDGVIDNYREGEIPERFLCPTARAAVDRVRETLATRHGATRFLPPHAIDLADSESAISPHVDSVKFSGGLVAGVSLLSAATMSLCKADAATGEELPEGPRYSLRLEPRSLYVLAGDARYSHAHSVVALDGRRVSVIFRDAKDDGD